MRKFILALTAVATLAVPMAANAQNWRERVRDDRREYREERREYRDALRYGDRGDIREERREYRDAARDLRRSEYLSGRYGRDGYPGRDWRDDRRYRDRYYGGRDYDRYYGRGGYHGDYDRPYWRDWRVGYRVPRGYWDRRYIVVDPYAYGLYGPRGGHWYRHGRDAFLIGFDGRVGDLRFNLFLD